MAGPLDYSTTAGSNTTVGGVSVDEGMTPGGVNNAMRAMMADSRKWQLDWSGVTTAGAADAYTMTCNQGIAAYADGMRFSFRADRNNTGAATLNIDARGAKALRKVVGGALAALIADDIVEKAIYDVVFNSADDVFVIVGSTSLTALGVTATATELNYVDGVTSAIQTQLNAKQASGATLTSLEGLSLVAGDILYATAADTLARLPAVAGRIAVTNAAGTAPEYVGYACRAWVNFNGTGTPAIRASGNVSSITDGGTGNYTINFTVSMEDANYSAIGNAFAPAKVVLGVPTASSIPVATTNEAGTATDPTHVHIAIFR